MKINGKDYNPATLDFNSVCELEDRGVSITDIKNKNLSLIRAYAALSMKLDNEAAGKEIEEHILAGGDMDEIGIAFQEAAENSGFFQALKKKSDKENQSGAEAEE